MSIMTTRRDMMAAGDGETDDGQDHDAIVMSAPNYPGNSAAVLQIDPYNDFLSDGGKLNGPAKAIIDAVSMIADTCLEATGRHGMELGYRVTLVRDATAAFSAEAMRAAHDVNGPTYAHAILTTSELLTAIPRQD